MCVGVWLVVVEVYIQNEHSALTCLRLVGNGVFRDLRAFSVLASRRRHVVSAQYMGDANGAASSCDRQLRTLW